MSREKQGYRDTILALNEMFPEQGMLSRKEVAQFLGVNTTTLDRWVDTGKLRMNSRLGRLTKADLARQICISEPMVTYR